MLLYAAWIATWQAMWAPCLWTEWVISQTSQDEQFGPRRTM
jgi:hypothetical protein